MIFILVSACGNAPKYSNIQKADPVCSAAVKTESGMIKGVAEKETQTCAWHGIPFAAPPINGLRWKAPAPPEPWQGVRDGSVWGPRCVQWNDLKWKFFNSDPSGKMSEDCLYLNIWRPKQDGKFPVMFFIHGGGYGLGTANTPTYWGDRMAQAGEVVVVTINYRLSLLGFLALPGLRAEDPDQSTGNYGTLDQVAALKWVKNNIANFKGDPENVTVFGESAGGWSICTLLATPLARGLFRQAIMESGGCRQSATLEQGYEQGKALAKKLGCNPGDLSCLSKVPAQNILEATPMPVFSTFVFGPHEDGYVLSAKPWEMIAAGNFNKVPVIFGTNRDEMWPNADSYNKDLKKLAVPEFPGKISVLFKIPEAQAQELVRLYPPEKYGNRPFQAFARMVTDFAFYCPTEQGLVPAAGQGVTAFRYRFDFDDYRLMGNGEVAMHAIELPFVFNSFDRRMFSVFFSKKQAQAAAPLSKTIQSYWLNFAKTGDPNGPGLPVWPKFMPDSRIVQVLDHEVKSEPSQKSGQCNYWDQHDTRLDW